MTEEFNGPSPITHVCRECGVEETKEVQQFVLALSGGRQLRGYWHPRCFQIVQKDIIAATRTSILSSDD